MRVGVYVDGYNLYYGGRKLCGRSTAGWRWLDVRSLARTLVGAQAGWPHAEVTRVIYCTAMVSSATSQSAHQDQDVYLKALLATTSVDHIEYGHYVTRVKNALIAVRGSGRRPKVVTSGWPIQVQDASGLPMEDARFMASVLDQEEKGSDVNLATHLIVDVWSDSIDAAVVISNDSDLRLPIALAREHVPVGLVNPRGGVFAGDLRAGKDDGVGNHWFRRLYGGDLVAHQLPNPAGHFFRPEGW